jgi:hypothetical protein
MADVSKTLNMSSNTLQTDLTDGQSLAAVAQAHGVTVTTLEGTLLTDAKAQIQSAVTSGTLTQVNATQMESHLSPMIDAMVTRSDHAMHGNWQGHGGWKSQSSNKTAPTASAS